jgi:hypothetical protein
LFLPRANLKEDLQLVENLLILLDGAETEFIRLAREELGSDITSVGVLARPLA